MSFSGELAYDVSVPWDLGAALWSAVLSAGEPFGIVPYGLEVLQVLRSEKGYIIVGQDTEGTTDTRRHRPRVAGVEAERLQLSFCP